MLWYVWYTIFSTNFFDDFLFFQRFFTTIFSTKFSEFFQQIFSTNFILFHLWTISSFRIGVPSILFFPKNGRHPPCLFQQPCLLILQLLHPLHVYSNLIREMRVSMTVNDTNFKNFWNLFLAGFWRLAQLCVGSSQVFVVGGRSWLFSLSGFSMCRLFIILVDVQISSLLVDMRNGRVGIMI